MSPIVTKEHLPKTKKKELCDKQASILKTIEEQHGKETALIIFYLFSNTKVWVPTTESINKVRRNSEIIKKWLSKQSIASLSKEYNMSNIWIREIIKKYAKRYIIK